MHQIEKLAQDGKLHIRMGLNGNVYAFSRNKQLVDEVAVKIGRSIRGVYYKSEYGLWALRTKSKICKYKLLALKVEQDILQGTSSMQPKGLINCIAGSDD